MRLGQLVVPNGSIKIHLPELPALAIRSSRAALASQGLLLGKRSRPLAIEIPDGSIYVDAPDLNQPTNYSCALAAASIARLYGVGPGTVEEFLRGMKTKRSGTNAVDIARYMNEIGLDAKIQENMSKDDLMDLLDEEVSTILAIQAYAEDPSEYDDPDIHDNGHYVASIGYSRGAAQVVAKARKQRAKKDDYFYFMDPSLLCRYGYLAWAELDKRWHDNDGTRSRPKISWHRGIVIRPNGHKPVHATVAERIE